MRQPHLASWRKLLLCLVWMVAFLVGPGGKCGSAHPGNISAALAKVDADGSFQVRVRFDLLAYALGELPNHIADAPMNALLDGSKANLESQLADAKARFRQGFRVSGSDSDVVKTFTFPSATEVLQSVKPGDRMRLPVMASVLVAGQVPAGTRTIAFRFDEGLGTIVLTTELPYQEPVAEPVEAGAFSTAVQIPTPEAVEKAAASVQRTVLKASPSVAVVATPQQIPRLVSTPIRVEKVPTTAATTTPAPVATPSPAPVPSPVVSAKTPAVAKPSPTATATPGASPTPSGRGITSTETVTTPNPLVPNVPEDQSETEDAAARWWSRFFQYIKLGYEHILPEGVDHILFVLGLFLLSTRAKSLLKQITAFTIAHSLTLALSLYGVIHLPASFVEPVIAASIAFVAVENLFSTEVKSWRLALVFGFGLIHGLGFAEALQELGLRQNNLLIALVGFNVGVELGQLSVVALAFLLVGRFRNHPNYRKYVVIPASLAISAMAVFWFFQRIV